jgi:uncharacterized protein (DUF608 family)
MEFIVANIVITRKMRFLLISLIVSTLLSSCRPNITDTGRSYNDYYTGSNLNKIAFPIGGIGAGMFCLEGTGAISHVSVRNRPDIFNEPCMFAAISLKDMPNGAKILEGQVPDWKKHGRPNTGNGSSGMSWGLPRFEKARFLARFPFAYIDLEDTDMPLKVQIKGWSPFIPNDADNSSLPVGGIEYSFENTGKSTLEAVFSYHSRNFMRLEAKAAVKPIRNGFILSEESSHMTPHNKGDFAIFTKEPNTIVDHCWFRGEWFDALTMVWNTIARGETRNSDPIEVGAPGASLFVPFTLKPGEKKVICLMMAWYVPNSTLRTPSNDILPDQELPLYEQYYKPWYTSKFTDIQGVADFWAATYNDLQTKSHKFTDAFFSSTLPAEVIEAVAANLTIIKSPTILRQTDGKLWAWEGSGDKNGQGAGSCTHVWNYAQAIPHLFPQLERTLRETEFLVNQNSEGYQNSRSALPIRPPTIIERPVADGQLGGIVKMYRDWRISGNTVWMKKMYPSIALSLDYCIDLWDPRGTGTIEEPHHNTYDIEFWGADGMCTSFYLAALKAIQKMGKAAGQDVSKYETLYNKGKATMENSLWDGEYFIQKIQWEGLNAPNPIEAARKYGSSPEVYYSPETAELLLKEGPKYQYGTGCLSDGVLGSWMAEVSGLDEVVDAAKLESHLTAVHKYNLVKDLRKHANPQRPSYAFGSEGGLLLCSWPKGGTLSLPFIYSNEVWTGIEYSVASHLMLQGEVEKGLDIVRTCRDRYDGTIRNPFNEYEYGHWYARAMASYAMLQGLTGVRYDGVDQVLYIDSRVGDFTSFLSTETGFGTVGLKENKPFIKVVSGEIIVKKCILSGKDVNYLKL